MNDSIKLGCVVFDKDTDKEYVITEIDEDVPGIIYGINITTGYGKSLNARHCIVLSDIIYNGATKVSHCVSYTNKHTNEKYTGMALMPVTKANGSLFYICKMKTAYDDITIAIADEELVDVGFIGRSLDFEASVGDIVENKYCFNHGVVLGVSTFGVNVLIYDDISGDYHLEDWKWDSIDVLTDEEISKLPEVQLVNLDDIEEYPEDDD